jgi:hypothetical protein
MAVLTATVVNDPVAHQMLRGAHDAGYRFPAGFGGFAATVTFSQDGAAATGTVELRSPRAVTLTIAADETGQAWLRQEIASMAGHRSPTDYETGDGRYTLTLGPDDDHPLGRLVQFHDDPFASSYRLRDGRITQVNRRMGKTRFTIDVQEHVVTRDGRLLPAYFTVAYWDVEQDRLTRADTYADRYTVVEGVFLPAARRVSTADDTGITVRELRLSDHHLLEGVRR